MLHDEDYASEPIYVTLPVGITASSSSISIIDDSLVEGNENFMLAINSTALPMGFFVNDPYEATVIIRDNDGKLIGYFFILFLYK